MSTMMDPARPGARGGLKMSPPLVAALVLAVMLIPMARQMKAKRAGTGVSPAPSDSAGAVSEEFVSNFVAGREEGDGADFSDTETVEAESLERDPFNPVPGFSRLLGELGIGDVGAAGIAGRGGASCGREPLYRQGKHHAAGEAGDEALSAGRPIVAPSHI